MKELFINLFNMSITASWFILAILVFRLIFKKAPKWVVCILWCLVGIRLICPFSIESRFSFLPKENSVSDIYVHEINTENSNYDMVQNHDEIIVTSKTEASHKTLVARSAVAGNHVTKHYRKIDFNICSYIWLIGSGLIAVYGLIIYIRLKLSLRDAVRYYGRVYQTEGIDTAFVLGIFKPVIYIPYGLDGEQLKCIIKHEQSHIKRRDHLIKPISYILLCVYWFNPIIWLAYIMFCHDIELACDERVIREIGYDKKKLYTQTILDCSSKKRIAMAYPVAFAEIGVKERVIKILKIKKAKKSIIISSLCACGIIGIGFMTSPLRSNAKNNTLPPTEQTTEEGTTEETSTEEVAVTTEITTEETATKREVTTENSVDTATTESNTSDFADNSRSSEEVVTDENASSEAKENSNISPDDVGSFAWPVSTGGVVTSSYGPRWGTFHYGYDIATPEGTPIVSAINGTVIETGYDEERGNYIIIERADGLEVHYHMLSEIISKVGDVVCPYEVVALSGNTGNSTGPHLHIGVFDSSGEAVDPSIYLYESGETSSVEGSDDEIE